MVVVLLLRRKTNDTKKHAFFQPCKRGPPGTARNTRAQVLQLYRASAILDLDLPFAYSFWIWIFSTVHPLYCTVPILCLPYTVRYTYSALPQLSFFGTVLIF